MKVNFKFIEQQQYNCYPRRDKEEEFLTSEAPGLSHFAILHLCPNSA